MRNRTNSGRPRTRDLVLQWLDDHSDDIGIVQLSVRELAKAIGRNQNTVNRALSELKAESHIIEYTLHRGHRVFRRRHRPTDGAVSDEEDTLQRRITELEDLTGHDRKLRPLIEQFAATEQTIAEIDHELHENKIPSKDRHTLRQDRAQQVLSLLRLSSQIGLSCQRTKKSAKVENSAETEPAAIPEEWLNDPSIFAQNALGIHLYPHQREFCAARQRVVVMIAGRGAGKSTASRVFALYTACRRPNHTVLVVSSGQRMSSDFGKRINDLIESSKIKNMVKSASASRIELEDGSCIVLLPAKPETIRGYHPRTAKGGQGGLSIILDEACFMEQGEEIRAAVEYALITTAIGDGQMVIASSPSSVHSWVYPLFLEGQKQREDIISFQWPSTVNPEISAEEVERLRQSRTDLEFRAEVLAEWVEGSHGLFTGLVDRAVVPSQGRELLDGEIATLGVDLALSYDDRHDASAFVVLARRESPAASGTSDDLLWPYVHPQQANGQPLVRYRVIELVRLTRATTDTVIEAAQNLVRQYGITRAAVEQYQGKALNDYLVGQGVETELIAPTAANQEITFNDLYNLFRQKLIEIPSDLSPILIDELKAFEYRRGPTGRFSFGHPVGSTTMHDDTVYALAWALHAHRRSLGQAVSPPLAIEFF